jgi:tetratricopeptide (TPR) repeat protein
MKSLKSRLPTIRASSSCALRLLSQILRLLNKRMSPILRTVAFAVSLACLACSAAFCQSPDQLFASGQFEQARQAYAAEVKAAPADADAQVGLVRSLLRLDHWEDAVPAAQAFAANLPANADAHGLLALSLIRAGWQPPYADEARKSLALNTQNYWGLIASGRAADWDAKPDEARDDFHKAAAAHPELPDAWADLFLLNDDRGHLKEQLEDAQSYVKLNPQGHPHTEIAEDARELLTHAAELDAAFGADPPFQRSETVHEDKPGATPSETPPLKVDFIGDYALFPVTINGAPFRLLFDTGGGNDILLDWKAARQLHLPVIAHSFIRGVSGKEPSDTLKAQTMTLSGLTYNSIEIDTADALANTGDGILGGDILQQSVVTLDFEQRTLTLVQSPNAQAPAPLPGDKSVALPFHFYHGDLYVQLAVNTVPVWALIDTGAELSTLSLRLAKQQLQTLPKDQVHTGSFSGRHGIGKTAKSTAYIASRAESQVTVSETPPASIAMETIGTSDLDQEVSPSAQCDFELGLWLGMSSFTYARRVTFDYPHKLMTFEYADPDAAPDANKAKTKKK